MSTAIYKVLCPDCGRFYASYCPAERTCNECQSKREERVCRINAMYPSAESLGMVQGVYDPLPIRTRYPHNSGRRIVRKSEPMAG